MEKSWYRQTAEETIKELNSSREGLSADEVTRRLEQYGPNKLVEKAKKGPISMFFEQFCTSPYSGNSKDLTHRQTSVSLPRYK